MEHSVAEVHEGHPGQVEAGRLPLKLAYHVEEIDEGEEVEGLSQLSQVLGRDLDLDRDQGQDQDMVSFAALVSGLVVHGEGAGLDLEQALVDRMDSVVVAGG